MVVVAKSNFFVLHILQAIKVSISSHDKQEECNNKIYEENKTWHS